MRLPLQGHPRLSAIARSGSGFSQFTDKNQGFLQRVQVQAHHITEFLNKLRISGELQGLCPSGCSMGYPDARVRQRHKYKTRIYAVMDDVIHLRADSLAFEKVAR